jgi:hypothetical protein
VRAGNRPDDYDSDDEYINTRMTMRQPLIHRQNIPATGVPVPTLDQRPSRNDAWSQRMREKVLDFYLLLHIIFKIKMNNAPEHAYLRCHEICS